MLLATAVSAVPKCRPVSSASSVTSTVASTSEDLPTETLIPTSTLSAASTSDEATESPFTTPTATVTQVPDLTTITYCPTTTTYNGSPAACFAPGSMFPACSSMTTAGGRDLNGQVGGCVATLKSYTTLLAPAATSCWPSNFYVANTVTASSIYACLVAPTNGLMCSYDSDCHTSTYTVGQEPTPTPSIGVNLVSDPSFESGTLGNWNVTTRAGTGLHVAVSSALAHTGKYSIAMHVDNVDGYAYWITGPNIAVEPGASYQLTYYTYQTNPSALTEVIAYAFPQSANNYDYFGTAVTPANRWFTGTVVTFTAATSWVNLAFYVAGNLISPAGSAAGINDVYIDDVSLVRLS